MFPHFSLGRAKSPGLEDLRFPVCWSGVKCLKYRKALDHDELWMWVKDSWNQLLKKQEVRGAGVICSLSSWSLLKALAAEAEESLRTELFWYWYQYQNAADSAKNTVSGISEYASLCTEQIPSNLLAVKQHSATFQSAQLALTDVTDLKSVFLCCSKTELKKFVVLPLATTVFKSDKKRGEPTELTIRLHFTIFYTLKSKETCKETFFCAGVGSVLCRPKCKFGYQTISNWGCMNFF